MSIDRSAAPTQLLRRTGGTLSVTYYADGVVVDPGVVTVALMRADGTALVPAAGLTASGTGAAARTITLTPAETAAIDILTATWTSPTRGTVTTDAEIVGDLLFTVAEARTFVSGPGAPLASTTKYPAAMIEDARARITDEFNLVLGFSPVPRLRRVILDGLYSGVLTLPDFRVTTIRSVETRASGGSAWTAYTLAALDDTFVDSGGVLAMETGGAWPSGRRNVRVTYEHGMQRTPRDLGRAALIVLVDQLVASNVGERTLSVSNDAGTFRLATAGERGAYFGLPAVDSVLDRHRIVRLAVG